MKHEQILKDIGKRIRALRERKGWTQYELGEKAGIDPKYLGSIERGEVNVSVGKLCGIAEALGVEVWELFFPLPLYEQYPAVREVIVSGKKDFIELFEKFLLIVKR